MGNWGEVSDSINQSQNETAMAEMRARLRELAGRVIALQNTEQSTARRVRNSSLTSPSFLPLPIWSWPVKGYFTGNEVAGSTGQHWLRCMPMILMPPI